MSFTLLVDQVITKTWAKLINNIIFKTQLLITGFGSFDFVHEILKNLDYLKHKLHYLFIFKKKKIFIKYLKKKRK